MIPTDWPEPRLKPQGGWTFHASDPTGKCAGAVLAAPWGQVYGPCDPLTVSQVAEINGVTHQAVSNRVERGSLPSEDLMGRRAIKARDALVPVPPAGRPKKVTE